MDKNEIENKLKSIQAKVINNLTNVELNKKFNNLNDNNIRAIVKHYTDKHRLKTVCKDSCVSPYDLLFSDAYKDIFINSKFFNNYDINHICMLVRLGVYIAGFGYIRTACAYSPKYCEYISKYNKNNKCYDFSCGWGTRLLYCLNNNIEYYGTDPNYELVGSLNELANDFKKYTNKKPIYNIKAVGSETFLPELENTIGVAFSSPPYFNLEDYKVGAQSIKNIDNFDQWVQYYVQPTLENIFKYLIKDGTLIVNITNSNAIKYNLEETFINVAKNIGFKYIKTDNVFQTSRKTLNTDLIKKYESFLIFKKYCE